MSVLATIGNVILWTVVYVIMLVFGIFLIRLAKQQIISAFRSVFKR